MVNRWAAPCAVCGATVPASGGTLHRSSTGSWEARHLACDAGSPAVVEVRTSSGWRGTRNRRGRCEDAPCCGCCTY